jgi:hypothetical protein
MDNKTGVIEPMVTVLPDWARELNAHCVRALSECDSGEGETILKPAFVKLLYRV